MNRSAEGEIHGINSRTSLVAIVYLSVIGTCAYILQPSYVLGLVEHIGLSDVQAGYVVSLEMFGIAFSTILMNFIVTRFDWRRLVLFFLCITVAGNLASAPLTEFDTLRAVRFLTGIGSGGLMSITMTMMGLTNNPDRNFGYIIVFIMAYSALGTFLIPVGYDTIGMPGVMTCLALFCATGVFFLRFLPRSRSKVLKTARPPIAIHSLPRILLALAGFLAWTVAFGMLFAYLFLIGLQASLSERIVANVLAFSQFLGIAGAYTAVAMQMHYGRMKPVAVSTLGIIVGIFILLDISGLAYYLLAIFIFAYMANVTPPYLFALMADLDTTGKVVTIAVSVQIIGWAIGASMAAFILGLADFSAVNMVAAALFVLSLVLLWPALRTVDNAYRRQTSE